MLVEPQPVAFEKLQSTYADVDGLVFLNGAVAEQRGSSPFYYLGDVTDSDPWFLGQIASFDRGHIVKHLGEHRDAVARIVSKDVSTMPLGDVLKQAPRPVEVLQIDAEGLDATIVISLDLTEYRPAVVPFSIITSSWLRARTASQDWREKQSQFYRRLRRKPRTRRSRCCTSRDAACRP